jgi:hypothetical protein
MYDLIVLPASLEEQYEVVVCQEAHDPLTPNDVVSLGFRQEVLQACKKQGRETTVSQAYFAVCTPRNFAQSSKCSGKKNIFWY